MAGATLDELRSDWATKEQRHRELFNRYFQAPRVSCGDAKPAPTVTPEIIAEIDRLEREAEAAHQAFLSEASRRQGA